MVVGIGEMFVQIPQRAAAERAMAVARAAAQEQNGCMSFVFAQVLEDPGHFLLVQRWNDQSSLDAHFRSASFATYQAAIAPLLVRDSTLELHTVEATVRPLGSSGLAIGQEV